MKSRAGKAGDEASGQNRYTGRVSDNEEATRDARRVLRLLQIHHRQHRESERIMRELAEQVSRQVDSVIGTDGAPAAGEEDEDAASRGTGPQDPWPALSAAASLARALPPRLRVAVAAKLPPQLEQQFLDALYSFDALPSLDARVLQAVVRQMNKRTLATALLGAPDDHFHAVTRNMSRRAAEMLREDMESLLAAGELSTRDVQDARAALSSVIREEAAGPS